MNPHLLAIKFFILLATTPATTPKVDNSMNDFVVERKIAYQPTFQTYYPKADLKEGDQSSVFRQHQMMMKQKLAVFCKIEHEVMQASGFAIKFRLGDQSYVDQLEGK